MPKTHLRVVRETVAPMPKVSFNKTAYRKNIAKLSLTELREALVREAELRFNSQFALLEIRDEIRASRSQLLTFVNDKMLDVDESLDAKITASSQIKRRRG